MASDKVVIVGRYAGWTPAIDGLCFKPARVQSFDMETEGLFSIQQKERKKIERHVRRSFNRASEVDEIIRTIFRDWDTSGAFLKITIERKE